MFQRYRMSKLRWLGFFVALLIAPGLVSLLIFGPFIVLLGVGGHPDVTLVAGGFGVFGIAAGLPFAILGIALCALLSKALGHFSFPQAFITGIVLAAAMAHWLAKGDIATMAVMTLAAAVVIVVLWNAMRLVGILQVSQPS